MPKGLQIFLIVVLVISLLLTVFTFNKLSQDISQFPYSTIRINDFNYSALGTIEIYKQVVTGDVTAYYTKLTFSNNVYNFGGNSLTEYFLLDFVIIDNNVVGNKTANIIVENVESYYFANVPGYYGIVNELTNKFEFNNNILSVGSNITVDISLPYIIEGTTSTGIGINFDFNDNNEVPFTVVKLSMDYSFNTFRDCINLISSYQKLSLPPTPDGSGWDFVLDIIIYDIWGGFVWLVQWFAVPISVLGGVFVW